MDFNMYKFFLFFILSLPVFSNEKIESQEKFQAQQNKSIVEKKEVPVNPLAIIKIHKNGEIISEAKSKGNISGGGISGGGISGGGGSWWKWW